MENTVEKILEDTLGKATSEKIRKFFLKYLLDSNYSVIIFTTRRCHVLFSLFFNYIFSEEEKKIIENKLLISDKGLHFNKLEIQNYLCDGKYCLVVDDILIHGKALTSIYKRLIQIDSINKKQIKFAVYAVSESPMELEFELEKFNVMSNANWEKLSANIVASIILTSTPYTAYVYSYVSKNKVSISDFNKLLLKLKETYKLNRKLDLTLNENKLNNKVSKKIEENIEAYIFSVPVLDNSGVDSFCIRVYYNKLLNKCIIIPFSFLQEYSKEYIDNYYNNLLGLNSIKEIDNYESKYRVLVVYESLRIFHSQSFFSVIENSFDINSPYIDFSYFKGFYDFLYKKLNNAVVLGKEEISSSYTTVKNKYKNFYEENLSTILIDDTKKDKFKKLFLDYLKKIEREEELYCLECEESRTTLEKQPGLLIRYIKNLKISEETKFEIITQIISAADTGLISIFPNIFFFEGADEIQFVGDFFVTGEQICRLYQTNYAVFIADLYKLYIRFISSNEFLTNLKDKKYKLITFEELFNKIIDEMKKSGFNNIREIRLAYYEYCKVNNDFGYDGKYSEYIYEELTEEKLKLYLMEGYKYFN